MKRLKVSKGGMIAIFFNMSSSVELLVKMFQLAQDFEVDSKDIDIEAVMKSCQITTNVCLSFSHAK